MGGDIGLTGERAPKLGFVAQAFDIDGVRWFLGFAAFILFCLGYYPTLVAGYVTEDQWRAFRYAVPANDAAFRWRACYDMNLPFYVYTGRPLVFLGECAEHAWVASIHDFASLRPFVLLLVLISVPALGAALTRVVGSFTASVIVAAVMLYSPGYAFMYFQGLTGAPVILGALLAILASPCLNNSFDRVTLGRGLAASGWLASGFVLFLLSLLIYPAYSFLAVALAVLNFGFDDSYRFNARLARLVCSITTYAIASGAYYAMSKLTMHLYGIFYGVWPALAVIASGPRAFVMHLTPLDLAQKVATLVVFFIRSEPIINFFGWSGWLKMAAFASAIPAFILSSRRSGVGWRASVYQTIAFAIVTVVLAIGSEAPWLVASPTPLLVHYTVPLQILVVGFLAKLLVELVTVAGASRMREPRGAALALLCLMLVPATFRQNAMTMTEVMLSRTEISYMRAFVRNLVISGRFDRLQQIHVIRPYDPVVGVNKGFVSGNPVGMLWFVTAVLREVLPAGKLKSLDIADCQFDRACIAQSAQRGALVLSQSLPGDKPTLLELSAVLDYSMLPH